MRKIFLSLLFTSILLAGKSQSPTWSGDIACLLYSHCTTCHHDNGIAPFSLTSYSDAYAHMAVMSYDVNNHIMPPYPPDITYQQYMDERYLSANELSLLNDWVNAGGPAGDTTQAPGTPVYSNGPVITNPGFTARIPTYTVPTLTTDLYRCFIVSNPFTQAEFISGMEVIPGNPAAVHHVLVYQDTSSMPVQLDSAAPGPGYTEFGGDGSATAELVGAWVPGSQPYFLPAGMGIQILPGARIIMQIHYPAGSSGLTDSTRINLQFSSASNLRKVYIAPVLAYYANMTNGPLKIPANAVDTFYEEYTVPAKVSVLAVAPHGHLVCTHMKSFGVETNGDTIPFINDTWNFHWQGLYAFKKPIIVPAATKIYGQAVYDNTDNNPLNPNSPPQEVVAGESTTNEMMLFFFSYTVYEAGDENTFYDTSTYIHTYDNCNYAPVTTAVNELTVVDATVYPNPTSGLLDITLNGTSECKVQVADISGRGVAAGKLNAGYNSMDLSSLAAGVYFITLVDLNGAMKAKTMRIIKQ
jgi:Secretion system C-terminal sorting domain/Copper type II ascorbate-dependent monooxygenase, N-terminal domain